MMNPERLHQCLTLLKVQDCTNKIKRLQEDFNFIIQAMADTYECMGEEYGAEPYILKNKKKIDSWVNEYHSMRDFAEQQLRGQLDNEN